MRLVALVDDVLDLLEADEQFVFTLDGQLATVDDYLEVRPEAEERIRRLVGEGRLAIGPWQTLMDEFLVSGETIWRNLETGLARAEVLGGAMRVGYLPDMFGHVAQMPQILRRFGLETAVVWRGVPAAIDRHAFGWSAPDGSAVRAEYLADGYGNGAYLLDVPGGLAEQAAALAEAMRPWFDGDPVLAMYGTDHMAPAADLVAAVEEANRDGRVRIELATLNHALESQSQRLSPQGTVPAWTGELRSGARANMLMGVASARIDLKQAAARAERALERYAEPLQALYGSAWPEALLRIAWRRILDNSAHDSICGCSADEVAAQVLVRYAEAEQIGDGLAQSAVKEIAAGAPKGSTVVVNPSPLLREGLVELDLLVPEDWSEVALVSPDGLRIATQDAGRTEPLLEAADLRGDDVPEFVDRRLHGRELFGRWLNGFRFDRVDGRPQLTLELDTERDPPWLDVAELRREIALAVRADGDAIWQVQVLARPRRRLLASVAAPPLGWTSLRPAEGSGALEHPVEAGGGTLENGLLRIDISGDGTLRLGGLEGVGRIVRGGDAGDSYNYAPPPDDRLVDEPNSVTVSQRESGPVVGRLEVVRRYEWCRPVDVTTSVELRAGEPFARVRISFDNPCSDQRVRFHLPLPRAAEGSFAEGQFAVVSRGLEVEGGYGERPLPTFPAHGFVEAGGVAVLLEHVLEYEVVDGRELALTLLRSIGWISRNDNPYREDPAGPEVPLPAAQMRGPWSVGFALYPHGRTWHQADVLQQLERYRLPFLASGGRSDRAEADHREGVEVYAGDGVVLTSLRRVGGELELRLVCESPDAQEIVVRGLGSEELRAELTPWEIRTLRVPGPRRSLG
jgi:Glycosyl hydrolases family 38 N-terminal domain/Alpha mannosidase middle domain